MHRSRLLGMALGGILALGERDDPMAGVYFVRKEGDEWSRWPPDSQPNPPTVADVPFALEPCEDHRYCFIWRGVHFCAIRFNGRVWDGMKGWID